ncbi:MAG: hypothetical protein R3B13_03640 [Polyangiaceae bacterium]
MKRILVRYRVKPDQVETNLEQVRAVFARLREDAPQGIRYATFRLADGVSFMHLASVETEDGANPLLALEEFRRFVSEVGARCDEPPVSVELEEVGSYRVLEGA